MGTIELELQKASIAREILTTTDEKMINSMLSLIKKFNVVVSKKEAIYVEHSRSNAKRKIGILEGKAKVIFNDNWSMTPEELNMV